MNLTERLTLRPFPYAIVDPDKRRSRWATYRKEMVSRAGVAIFVFGNKVDASGAVLTADGMLEEFELAHSAGLLLIPVGSTGYVAGRLHKQVSEDLSKYFPQVRGLKTALAALDTKRTPSDMVESILRLIALARPRRARSPSPRRSGGQNS